jgi:hypothetical protein
MVENFWINFYRKIAPDTVQESVCLLYPARPPVTHTRKGLEGLRSKPRRRRGRSGSGAPESPVPAQRGCAQIIAHS